MIDPDHTYFTKPQHESIKGSKMNKLDWMPYTDEEWEEQTFPKKEKKTQ